MASEWWRRLPAGQRREYERSDTITRVPLAPDPRLAAAVLALDRALVDDDLAAADKASQFVVTRICAGLDVPPARVRVEGLRPHDRRGELHGLYAPSAGPGRDRITVWMRTAKRGDVVRTRTFVRTLLHEVCHHLDFALFSLPSSFHSRGFYQRESSLMRVVVRGTPLARPARGRGPRADADQAATGAEAAPPRSSGPAGIDLLRAAAAAIAARQKTDG
jgi:hypothetical protein